MFINVVTQLHNKTRKMESCVSDQDDLFELLMIYEASPNVKAYKIFVSELPQVTDIHTVFGWDRYSWKKLVTEFDWS